MANPRQPENIKRKIVTGFVVLLALALIAVYAVIKLASQLSPADSGVSSSVSKLSYTSNLLSGIIEAGGQARAFISTGDSQYHKKYMEEIILVDKTIDSLKIKSISNTNQYLRILAVDSLTSLKNLTYQNYFNLRSNVMQQHPDKYNTILNKYINTFKSADKTISQTIREQLPPREVKKKGFFPKLWGSISGKKKRDTMQADTMAAVVSSDTSIAFTTYRDTTIKKVKKQLNLIEEQQTRQRELLAERELMLVQADQDIMNEIRAILLLFEKEEINKTLESAEKGQEVLKRLWFTAFIMASLGLLTAFAFIFLIWKDLARSSFYRRQLEEARTLAESLLKVKEQFLANISHEIRTPLTSIIGFSERLASTEMNDNQRKYLSHINSSSEHLLELINDLLDFSKINSTRIQLEAKPFNPSLLFEQSFGVFAPRARSKNLIMILKQDIPESDVIGDSLRLRQIVLNLLSNSVKFTETGSVIMQVKARLSDKEQRMNFLIRVADTGIGIPNDKLNAIFDEFIQVDPGITRKFGGSGLGLAITKKLVELMQGSIVVHSKPGKGTMFTLRFSLPATPQSNYSTTHVEYIDPQLSGVQILIAEDDDTTRILLSDLLTHQNAHVTLASDGKDAFTLFSENPQKFRILISDIQMPGYSGPELVERIHTYCRERNISKPLIIGLTAHADNTRKDEFLQNGFDGIVFKPFRHHEILKVLTQHSSANEVPETEIYIAPTEHTNTQLNLDAFRQFSGSDEKALIRIIESLRENIVHTLLEMQDAYSSGNIAALGLLAHRMAPNIKLLGATNASSALRHLEEVCKDPGNVIDDSAAYYHLVVKLLQEIVEQMDKSRVPG